MYYRLPDENRVGDRMKTIIFAVVALALVGCGESNEEAYERGVEDGADEVCQEARRIAEGVYEELRSRRYCN